MSSKHYEIKCEICGDLIYEFDYPNDHYEMRRYNKVTHKTWEERRFETPESSVEIYICSDCWEKDSAIKEKIKEKRILWYDKEIEKTIKNKENKENELVKIHNEILDLINNYEELIVKKQELVKNGHN
jgi:hypothetical protein